MFSRFIVSWFEPVCDELFKNSSSSLGDKIYSNERQEINSQWPVFFQFPAPSVLMAGHPLSILLSGCANDVKEHLRPAATAVVADGVVLSVKSLLECAAGTQQELRGGCSAWGIPAKRNGKYLPADALKEALLDKLLGLLPPISFGSLLEQATEDVHGGLADYKAALVAAADAKRVLELLMALGPVQRGGDEAFKRICSAWKVQVQQGRKRRPRAELQAALRGSCIRFLKESESSAVSPVVESAANSVVPADASSADSPGQASGNGQDPQNLADAHAAVCASGPAVRTRVAGKRHAVAFVPKDLEFWQNWQKRWIESREVRLQQDTPKHRRSAFFAHVKQYCGNAVWARLLVQFGPTALDKILPAMILARDMRPEVNLPVHDQARDHVRILMRTAAASHDPPAPMASASAPSGRWFLQVLSAGSRDFCLVIHLVVAAVTSADACCPAVSRMVLSSVVTNFLAGYKSMRCVSASFVLPPYTVWGLLPG